MKSKTIKLGDYTILMETPKHSSVIDAELRSTEDTAMGMPYVNQSKYRMLCVAMSIRSVKDKDTEVGANFDGVFKFLNDLEQDKYPILELAYNQLVDIRPYVKNLEESEPEVKPVSSKIQSVSSPQPTGSGQ